MYFVLNWINSWSWKLPSETIPLSSRGVNVLRVEVSRLCVPNFQGTN